MDVQYKASNIFFNSLGVLLYVAYISSGSTACSYGKPPSEYWTDILISNDAWCLLYEYLIPGLYLIPDL